MPLNGEKMHRLSAHALGVLDGLSRNPIARQLINAGVCARLEDGALAEQVFLPSPFARHGGKNIPHLAITEAGRTELRKNGADHD